MTELFPTPLQPVGSRASPVVPLASTQPPPMASSRDRKTDQDSYLTHDDAYTLSPRDHSLVRAQPRRRPPSEALWACLNPRRLRASPASHHHRRIYTAPPPIAPPVMDDDDHHNHHPHRRRHPSRAMRRGQSPYSPISPRTAQSPSSSPPCAVHTQAAAVTYHSRPRHSP